jgi:hypothetical protein
VREREKEREREREGREDLSLDDTGRKVECKRNGGRLRYCMVRPFSWNIDHLSRLEQRLRRHCLQAPPEKVKSFLLF